MSSKKTNAFVVLSFLFSIPPITIFGQSFDVKFKVGIVLNSGDVKNVARQTFLICNSDNISPWLSLQKNNYNIDYSKIREKTDYANKISLVENRILELRKSLPLLENDLKSKKKSLDTDDLQTKWGFIKRHIKTSIELGKKWKLEKSFNFYIWGSDVPVDFGYLSMLNILDIRYNEILESNKSSAFQGIWQAQYSDFNRITESVLNDLLLSEKSINNAQEELRQLEKEIVVNRRVFENEIETEGNILKQRYLPDYRQKIVKSIVANFKTNLSGEATVKLPKGTFFIVGFAEIGNNEIYWNLSFTVYKEGGYIELSNDNAFSINEKDLIKEIKSLLLRT